MESGNPARRSRALPFLAAVFIAAYFFAFTHDSLRTYFSFDDGMNMVHLHHIWEVPLGANVVEALTVFTDAYRPLGALFYRPLYQLFGFDPLPFRIVAYLLLAANVVLAYRFFRALDASREAATLATLLVCYNASMFELYYNTGTIYDVLCFPLYIGAVVVYAQHRTSIAMAAVALLFLAALDAKEMAVTLPALLLLYEAVYGYREFRPVRSLVWRGGFIAVMFVIAAFFVRAKVAAMSDNAYYHPNVTPSFVLTGIGHYFEQVLYLNPGTLGPWATVALITALLGVGAILRSRAAIYGTLFFVIGLLPISVISYRNGYAAYLAYPGLALALGSILDSGRMALLRLTRTDRLRTPSTVVLFFAVAVVSVMSLVHTRKIWMDNVLWDEQRRIDLLTVLKRQIPQFPPNSRILLEDDAWGPDWGPMFLIELMYHDGTLWVDRPKNSAESPDRSSYDYLITYKQPHQNRRTPKFLGIKLPWEVRWFPMQEGVITIRTPA